MTKKHFYSNDEVFADLCMKIEKLVYMPGDPLFENTLCSIYEVSRNIIRTVITRLKERELVDVYPQRGTFVSLIDIGLIEDIIFLRESMEQKVIDIIMADDKKCALIAKEMLQKAEKMESCLEKEDYAYFYDLDSEIHHCMLEAAGHASVMRLFGDTYIHFLRWRNLEVRTKERYEEICKQHRELISALLEKKGERAKAILHMHLDTSYRYYQDFKKDYPQYFYPEKAPVITG
ncbi:MAG: GntR family transcriptional regulator [Fusobacteriaceae bacterium]|jgi:DNA-binding GntR family transcriptional regulator|nr:GntR family transcriptional regulator [Fusobacteriaceae bacterium]